MADQALTALEVDQLGLDAVDRRMLCSIIAHYAGGPVGLETLAATVGEEAVTLEESMSLTSCRWAFSRGSTPGTVCYPVGL